MLIDKTLSEVGEFSFLEEVISRLGEGKNVLVGPGDDAAVVDLLAAAAGDLILQTTDMLVEGTHFTTAAYSAEDIGYKSIAVNLSDIAAMGGEPLYVLLSIAAPASTRASWLARLVGEAARAAEAAGAAIIGGDVTRSDTLTISVTITGRTPSRRLGRRDGARPGDLVLVTGTFGDSAAGLKLLKDPPLYAQLSEEGRAYLASRHLRPVPRIAEGRVLAARGATAMIDSSDGLLRDLAHICERGGVAAEIVESSVPVSGACEELSRISGASSPFELALSGGEDYELIATIPEEQKEVMTEEIRSATGLAVSMIGRIVESASAAAPEVALTGGALTREAVMLTGGVVTVVRPDGSSVPSSAFASTGWDSFVSPREPPSGS